MGVSGNPANRAAARRQAKEAGGRGRILSQLIVLDDLGDKPHELIAAAIVTGLGSLVEQGGAPLERSAITLGGDHPEHPGKIVVEVKTDRIAPRRFELGAPLRDLNGDPK